jgi:hypothetical protein
MGFLKYAVLVNLLFVGKSVFSSDAQLWRVVHPDFEASIRESLEETPEDPECWSCIARIEKWSGVNSAFQSFNFQDALTAAPQRDDRKDAEPIQQLVLSAILVEDSSKTLEYLSRLKAVNPANVYIGIFHQMIGDLARKEEHQKLLEDDLKSLPKEMQDSIRRHRQMRCFSKGHKN